MTQTPKPPASPREWWIYEGPSRFKDANGIKTLRCELHDQKLPNGMVDSQEFHVIEYSALTEAQEALRTFRDKYYSQKAALNRANEEIERLEKYVDTIPSLVHMRAQLTEARAEVERLRAEYKRMMENAVLNTDAVNFNYMKWQGAEAELATLREELRAVTYAPLSTTTRFMEERDRYKTALIKIQVRCENLETQSGRQMGDNMGAISNIVDEALGE